MHLAGRLLGSLLIAPNRGGNLRPWRELVSQALAGGMNTQSDGRRPDAAEPQAQSGTSLSLLLRLREGQPAAWERLLDLYGPLVCSWCRRGGLNQDDAADVVQEVFASVSSSLNRFRRERPGDSFRGWLRVITRRAIADVFRQRQKQAAARGGDVGQEMLQQIAAQRLPDATPEEETQEQSGVIQQAAKLVQHEFEPTTWRAFWRVAVDGRPSPEVAEELGISPGAVRQAKYRVVRRLRAELEGLLD
jgi:RNA polymerase sigma-70 factor (ECF subfamily)